MSKLPGPLLPPREESERTTHNFGMHRTEREIQESFCQPDGLMKQLSPKQRIPVL